MRGKVGHQGYKDKKRESSGKELMKSKDKIGGKRDYLWHEEKWQN